MGEGEGLRPAGKPGRQVFRSGGQRGFHEVSGAGGKYRTEGTDREEIAEKIAEWSGEETEGSTTEGLATEEEAETAGGTGGGFRKTRMATAWV